MSIDRGPESYPGRTRTVRHGGLLHVVVSAPDKTEDMAGQTRQCLAWIDSLLAEAGTDKSRLITATVYLADMAQKSAMNEVWDAWIDPENPPARACVQSPALAAPAFTVEIMVTAAL